MKKTTLLMIISSASIFLSCGNTETKNILTREDFSWKIQKIFKKNSSIFKQHNSKQKSWSKLSSWKNWLTDIFVKKFWKEETQKKYLNQIIARHKAKSKNKLKKSLIINRVTQPSIKVFTDKPINNKSKKYPIPIIARHKAKSESKLEKSPIINHVKQPSIEIIIDKPINNKSKKYPIPIKAKHKAKSKSKLEKSLIINHVNQPSIKVFTDKPINNGKGTSQKTDVCEISETRINSDRTLKQPEQPVINKNLNETVTDKSINTNTPNKDKDDEKYVIIDFKDVTSKKEPLNKSENDLAKEGSNIQLGEKIFSHLVGNLTIEGILKIWEKELSKQQIFICLFSFLYHEARKAENKTGNMGKIVITLDDPDSKICDFIRELGAYARDVKLFRKSSMLSNGINKIGHQFPFIKVKYDSIKSSFKGSSHLVKISDEKHYSIDVPENSIYPNDCKTVLFFNYTSCDGKKRIFLKPEECGTGSFSEFFVHMGHYALGTVLGIKKHDSPTECTEREKNLNDDQKKCCSSWLTKIKNNFKSEYINGEVENFKNEVDENYKNFGISYIFFMIKRFFSDYQAKAVQEFEKLNIKNPGKAIFREINLDKIKNKLIEIS